jgi:hypothetical protein
MCGGIVAAPHVIGGSGNRLAGPCNHRSNRHFARWAASIACASASRIGSGKGKAMRHR